MSKKKSQPSTKNTKSPIEILIAKYGLWGTIITAIVGLVGVGISGYLTYAGIRLQVEAPIIATQTAQSDQLTWVSSSAPAYTSTPARTPILEDTITASPLDILSLLVGQSDTDYRFDLTIRNTDSESDRLISHIDIKAVQMDFSCDSHPEWYRISDTLIVQQISNSTFSAQGHVTNNLNTSFEYPVRGMFEIGGCGERSFILGFDTSMLVPRGSTAQFYIQLPRELKIIIEETDSGSQAHSGFLPTSNDDILEEYDSIIVSVWDADAMDPVIISKSIE